MVSLTVLRTTRGREFHDSPPQPTTAYTAATVTRMGDGHGIIERQSPEAPGVLSTRLDTARGFAVSAPERLAAMSRKSTGKRLRFEVFKRDHFTCQYCGAQPPDVVLVADHIDAVAAGGATTIDNLITACEACNQGKSDRALTMRQIRPDADLLYLESQQEIAELQRYLLAKAERNAALDEVAVSLEKDFQDTSGRPWVVADRVIRPLLDRYDAAIVERAVRAVGYRIRQGRLDTYGNGWIAYLNGVARNIAQEENED